MLVRSPFMATLLRNGDPVGPVQVARTFHERSRGLLGRDGIEGALWIEPARSIHTFGMRFAIDVAFADRAGLVCRVVTVAPNRLTRIVLAARCVVEAEAGTLSRWSIAPGDRLRVEDS